MLKRVSICAAFIVLGMTSLKAQQLEAVLQRVELPGAGVEVLLAMPKSPATTIDLGESPDALILHLSGGELALGFEDGRKMLEVMDFLQHPACAFRAHSDGGKSAKPVSVYVVPKRATTASTQTTSFDGQLPGPGMRKVKVPGSNFNIVYVTTRAPIAWDSDERPDAIAVSSLGYELTMATDDDIERMFQNVGLSQWPSCAFGVEHVGSNPPQAASVYVVADGDLTDSASQ